MINPKQGHSIWLINQVVGSGAVELLPNSTSSKKEMNILLKKEIGIYLEETKHCDLFPMFYLELTIGLRRSELLMHLGKI